MIRVGLLGAGNIARAHCRALQQIPNAQVVAVCDTVEAKARDAAAPWQAQVYDNMVAFLHHPSMDMVDICLPTYLHAQAVIAAAEAGKHILCEKPIALSLEEADRMVTAVHRAGVRVMVAQVIRFWPHYLAIKAMMERGELGAPIVAHAARLGAMPAWSGWFSDPALSGGALLDLHIHDLDWLYWLFGWPSRVYAVGRRSDSGAWNQIITTLDFGPVKATAEASLSMPRTFPFTMSFRLLGEKGYAEYTCGGVQADPRPRVNRNSLVVYLAGEGPIFPPCPDEDPYLAEIRYFVTCLEEKSPVSIATLDEARRVLAIAMAVRQSLESGAVISLARI